MNTLNALGFFMDYCNRNTGRHDVTEEKFQRGMQEIINSPDYRFDHCCDIQDILSELGWWW